MSKGGSTCCSAACGRSPPRREDLVLEDVPLRVPGDRVLVAHEHLVELAQLRERALHAALEHAQLRRVDDQLLPHELQRLHGRVGEVAQRDFRMVAAVEQASRQPLSRSRYTWSDSTPVMPSW